MKDPNCRRGRLGEAAGAVMSRGQGLALPILAVLLIALGASEAGASTEEGSESAYAKKGSVEIGGALALDWGADSFFNASIGPSFGYFVSDRVELSAILNYNFEREVEDGLKEIIRSADFVLEPSYHHPVSPSMLVLGGVGAGFDYEDGYDFNFEIVPRVGLNIEVGGSAVITPAFKLPIVFTGAETVVEYAIETRISATW